VTTAVLNLRQQRCFHHPQREASARCPECRHYYCRECITEHDDRVVCASCLAKLTRKKEKRAGSWDLAPRVALVLVAFILVFLIVFFLGDALLSIPSQFHEAGGW
jgi:uncharacterized paraquat-inducible protein A